MSSALVGVAKSRGVVADYGPHMSKSGWSDWRIVAFALDNDYIVVTNNRKDFLREYVKIPLHNGLVVIVPNPGRREQSRLFGLSLDHALTLGADLTNHLLEVLADGSVHLREWTSEQHDIGHIQNPKWP